MCACKHVKLGIYVEGLVWEVKLCSNGLFFLHPFFLLSRLFSGAYTYTRKKKIIWSLWIFPKVAQNQRKMPGHCVWGACLCGRLPFSQRQEP